MSKKCILISGPTITGDKELLSALKKCARILKNSDNARIESILTKQEVDLILLEMLIGEDLEVALIRRLDQQFPELAIVVIDGNGDRRKIALALNYGAKDAFRRPYKCDLIVERVNALLRRPLG